MLRKSIFLKKLPTYKIRSKMDLSDFLDILELLAIVLCIPIAYTFTGYLVNTFEFPFYDMEFKMFLLQYLNYFNHSWNFDPLQFTIFSILILISWYTMSHFSSLARLPRNQRYLTVIVHFIRGNFFIFLVLVSFKFILGLTSISLIFIVTYVTISLIFTLIIRVISIHLINIYRASGYNLWRVIVIADGNYSGIVDELIRRKQWGFKIVLLLTNSDYLRQKYGSSLNVIQDLSNLKSILDNSVIDEILYCKKEADQNEIHRIAEICNETGIIFRIQSSKSEVDPMQISFRTVNQKGKLALVDIPSLKLPLVIKTMGDLYLSIIALILLFPLMLIITILIKLDSRGPVFFKQERVGLRGRKFKLYKFRTMVDNAEQLLNRLNENNEMDGPVFKMKNDPRITRLGKFLRKTGIDEFPQLYNVIKGEMSLIGPRPPLESEVKQYERWQLRRLSVKPGITCTWQIMPQRNEIKFEKWMQMDLNYIDNWSLGHDFKLFYQTLATFFHASGR
jgi:exopolysaccharide biosynthesis polyprenyl glycosylphosphotransferase